MDPEALVERIRQDNCRRHEWTLGDPMSQEVCRDCGAERDPLLSPKMKAFYDWTSKHNHPKSPRGCPPDCKSYNEIEIEVIRLPLPTTGIKTLDSARPPATPLPEGYVYDPTIVRTLEEALRERSAELGSRVGVRSGRGPQPVRTILTASNDATDIIGVVLSVDDSGRMIVAIL